MILALDVLNLMLIKAFHTKSLVMIIIRRFPLFKRKANPIASCQLVMINLSFRARFIWFMQIND